jgi:hypothetical protein
LPRWLCLRQRARAFRQPHPRRRLCSYVNAARRAPRPLY